MTQPPVRVMLVEDNALLARELSAALQELGNIEVVAVVDSEPQACKLLRQRPLPCDLLVIDVFLTTGSGLGVLRAAQGLDQALSVFMLTHFATLDVRKRCVALGADRVFDKTRQLDDFLCEVAALAGPDPALAAIDLGADTQWP